MMKKFSLALLTVLAATLGCNAQIFWKISGNGLEKPSYLLGTHHVAPSALLDTLSGFENILNSVDKVYGELIMSESQTPAAQQKMMMAATAPADSTLSKVFSPAQIDSLTTILQQYMGPMVSAANFEPLKPAMVSTLISMMQSQAAFPTFDPTQQLDGKVQALAATKGKEIGAFETLDEQCAILFGSPISIQADDLLSLLRHSDKAVEMAHKLADAYMSGDLNAMLALMEDPEMGTGEATDRLINDRNANWMRIMAALLPTASVLIAVGAGHLPGEKGILSMLKEKGYTVEPVN